MRQRQTTSRLALLEARAQAAQQHAAQQAVQARLARFKAMTRDEQTDVFAQQLAAFLLDQPTSWQAARIREILAIEI